MPVILSPINALTVNGLFERLFNRPIELLIMVWETCNINNSKILVIISLGLIWPIIIGPTVCPMGLAWQAMCQIIVASVTFFHAFFLMTSDIIR